MRQNAARLVCHTRRRRVVRAAQRNQPVHAARALLYGEEQKWNLVSQVLDWVRPPAAAGQLLPVQTAQASLRADQMCDSAGSGLDWV